MIVLNDVTNGYQVTSAWRWKMTVYCSVNVAFLLPVYKMRSYTMETRRKHIVYVYIWSTWGVFFRHLQIIQQTQPKTKQHNADNKRVQRRCMVLVISYYGLSGNSGFERNKKSPFFLDLSYMYWECWILFCCSDVVTSLK